MKKDLSTIDAVASDVLSMLGTQIAFSWFLSRRAVGKSANGSVHKSVLAFYNSEMLVKFKLILSFQINLI